MPGRLLHAKCGELREAAGAARGDVFDHDATVTLNALTCSGTSAFLKHGAICDLGGTAQAVGEVATSGLVRNGALTVTGGMLVGEGVLSVDGDAAEQREGRECGRCEGCDVRARRHGRLRAQGPQRHDSDLPVAALPFGYG